MDSTKEEPSNLKLANDRTRQAIATIGSALSSPSTPLRSASFQYGSPGSSYRSHEDEHVIIELGARYLRAGLQGECAPRCTIDFGPETQRRVGDYRQWAPDYASRRRKRRKGLAWGEDHELWRMDLRGLDLGLVEDKLERALREVFSKYLLLDSKPRKVLLALPSLMPRQLLSSALSVIFTSVQAPSISLFPAPVLCAVGAGLRSALVVDVGWAETTVTAVYEYREIHTQQSTRAGKLLLRHVAKMLDTQRAEGQGSDGRGTPYRFTLEDAEEVLTRLCWCMDRDESQRRISSSGEGLEEMGSDNPLVTIPLPTLGSSSSLEVPFRRLAQPAESALFAANTDLRDLDDHEQPLHLLVYRSLLALATDARNLCMSRIIFTGGVSSLPGVKQRTLEELRALVGEGGWDRVREYGKASRQHKAQINGQKQREADADVLQARETLGGAKGAFTVGMDVGVDVGMEESAHYLDGPHAVLQNEERQRKLQERDRQVQGVLRGVESLGAWAGGSLVATFKVRGVAEIERDQFLQQGLAGASKERDVSVVQPRNAIAPGTRPAAAADRTSWSLGVWT